MNTNTKKLFFITCLFLSVTLVFGQSKKTNTPKPKLSKSDTIITDSLSNRIIDQKAKELKTKAQEKISTQKEKVNTSLQKAGLSIKQKENTGLNKTAVSQLKDQSQLPKSKNQYLTNKNVKSVNPVNSSELNSDQILDKGTKKLNSQTSKTKKELEKYNPSQLEKNAGKIKQQTQKKLTGSKDLIEKQLLSEKKKITGKAAALKTKANTIEKKGVEGNLRDTKVAKKAEGKKKNIESKAKEFQNMDAQKAAAKTQIGQNIIKHKDSNLQSMMGKKNAKTEREKFNKEGIVNESLKDYKEKEKEYKDKLNKTKVAKLQANFRQKLYNKKPNYKEFIFKEKKSFFERFNLSANAILANNNLNALNIAPMFEIEVNPMFLIQLGPSFQHSLMKESKAKNTLSLKLSARYTIIDKKVYLYAENQSLAPKFSYLDVEEDVSQWEHAPLFGAGVAFKEIIGVPLNLTVLYNPNANSTIANGKKGFNLNIGFQF